MSSFEETIARMKGLYTYGQELNEDKRTPNCTLEFHKQGADGIHYGIVKECSKYYIKSAPKGKETIAEAYEYLGGFCNKKDYEYTSYANALKHFKLKLGSINEACDANVQTENTDSFMSSNVLMTESTDAMKREIARQRQIMYNVSMIMNESTGINPSKTPVMFDGENPEAPKGKSKNDNKKTTANPEFKGTNTKGLKTKAAPFETEKKVNENCDEAGCSENDWGSEGIGKGKDPKKVGWEMDGQTVVSEEEEWDEGLPSSAGVGDANTKKNNKPFTEMNEEEDSELDNVESNEDDMDSDDDIDFGVNDNEESDDMDLGTEDDEFGDEEDEFGDEGDEFGGEDDEFGGEDDEFGNEDDEFGDEDDEFGDEGDKFGDEGDEFGAEGDEFGDEDDEFGNEDDEFGVEGDEFGDEGDEFGGEDDEFGDEGDEFGDEDDEFGDEGDEFGDKGDEFGDEDDEFGDEDDEDGDIEECGAGCDPNTMLESKQKKMNQIVENVVNKILSEDELHVFGKHPGYRKKPFTLPTTGQDKNEWGEDWNDESVYSEQPFGETIGDGKPFNELVQQITQDVLYQLKTGSAFKKKAK